MEKIIKYLLGLALTIGICYLGIYCIDTLSKIPKEDGLTIKWVLTFFGVYIVIIRPIVAYWADKIWELLGLDKIIK